MNTLIPSLIDLCARHTLPAHIPAVLPEPYFPHLPAPWNGVLVLGEAQHLGRKNDAYRQTLRAADSIARYSRLNVDKTQVRITPWDDKTLPFAIEAALGVRAEECAVSNAVPWSQVNEADDNANPSQELMEHAQRFWRNLFSILTPTHVIASGGVSRTVLDLIAAQPGQSARFFFPRLPSPRSTASLIRLFPESTVGERFPSVARKIQEHPDWLAKYRTNKIAYACHMVECVNASGSPADSLPKAS